jgi:hypothetical protein
MLLSVDFRAVCAGAKIVLSKLVFVAHKCSAASSVAGLM